MINNSNFRLYIYIFINLLRFAKVFFLKIKVSGLILKNFNFKKNLFFKKKSRKRVLLSKRLSIVLRKRKRFKQNKISKIDKGNFFFKKHFYRTLYKNRKFLKTFFFLNLKIRQKKITKKILINQKQFFSKNSTYEYTALNILLRGHFCLFLSDALLFFKYNFIYLNGVGINNIDRVLVRYDCLQLKLCKSVYVYLRKFKKFLKKKN